MTKSFLDKLTYDIIGAAIEVHRELGPGLLESVYQKILRYEFGLRNIDFKSQLEIPVNYKGWDTSVGLRCDFYIENSIVLEIKAVESIMPIHKAQLLTYMKVLKAPKGILINFNCVNIFESGQKTFVNENFRSLPD